MSHSARAEDEDDHPHAADPLQNARSLHARIKGLRQLLELQQWQIETLNDRLYSQQPGGVAARRLLALKRIDTKRR
jgi:hypothetical protein